MSQNPAVKLARNTELAFTEAHLTDLKAVFSAIFVCCDFPDEPGLAGIYWSRGWWKWWWQLELQVVQSSSQIIITDKPTPSFYRPDALPVAQPTASKHWRENITFHTCLPQTHLGVFLLCLWPLTPGYLGEDKTVRLVDIIRSSRTASKNWCKTTTAVYCEWVVQLQLRVGVP